MNLVIWILIIMLSGCAATYHPSGTMVFGYKDRKISNDTYEVEFTGNGITSMNRIHDFALLRASEVCYTVGKKYFSVIREQTFYKYPNKELRIKLFDEKPADPSLEVYECQTLMQDIKIRYGSAIEN